MLASREYSPAEPYFDVYTYEGGTDECARVGGNQSMRVRRRLFPALGDCFLRWTTLDPNKLPPNSRAPFATGTPDRSA